MAQDQFLRLQADFENFRKRQAAEKEQLSEKNTAKVVEEFIPLVDNFELARQQVKVRPGHATGRGVCLPLDRTGMTRRCSRRLQCETEGEDKINQAYQGLYRQMVDTFRRLGVDAVPTVGVQFDPAIHDAVMRVRGGTPMAASYGALAGSAADADVATIRRSLGTT